MARSDDGTIGRVYVLRDPETYEPRYVGQTIFTAEQRRNGHMLGAGNGSTMRVAEWIRSLPTEPHVTVLEEVPVAELDGAERRWIRTLQEEGAALLNSAGVTRA